MRAVKSTKCCYKDCFIPVSAFAHRESGVDAGDGYRGGAHENALAAHGHAHASGVWSRSTQSRADAGGGRRARGCEYA